MTFLKNFRDILLSNPKGHRSQLDFLRFWAIALVFLTHVRQHFVFDSGIPSWLSEHPILVGGWVGVDIFFVLSGFLIGGQLWKEFQSEGKINYKNFIIKRSLRIWPLFYSVLIIFLIIRGPFDQNWAYSDFYFLSNYIKEGGIKGSWSLSVEEQFYILMPLLFLVLSKLKFSLRSGRIFCILALIASPFLRYLSWKYALTHSPASPQLELKYIYFPFHTHMDGLMLGVLLSNIYVDEKLKHTLNWKPVAVILFIAAACSLVLRMNARIYFNYSFFAYFFGFALWVLLHTKTFLHKIFDWPIFSLVAKLSFGIYLVQRELMEQTSLSIIKIGQSFPPVIHFIIYSTVMFLLCMLVTALTYRFIEWPALEYRKNLLKNMKD
ncbi:MAG: acyltransferase [Bacteriovorax sp.]|jgi:peptidoglycan/LPS O-acetylase OafA/YrhL